MPEHSEPQPSFWWKLVHLDPAIFRGLIMAVVLVLGSVGIFVSDELANNLVIAWVAIMAVVQALWTKRGVTPNAKVVVQAPDPVNAPGTVAPGEAVTDASAEEIIEAARTSGS